MTGPGRRMQRPGIDAVLAAARRGVRRLSPEETLAAVRRGALVVDTLTESQRRRQGELPGAIVIDRTVLEWRLDPASDSRIPEATAHDVEVVVVCRQGFSSSLAAASALPDDEREVPRHGGAVVGHGIAHVLRALGPGGDERDRAVGAGRSSWAGPDWPEGRRPVSH